MDWLGNLAAFIGVLAYAALVYFMRLKVGRFFWVKVQGNSPESWDALQPTQPLFLVVFILPLVIALGVVIFLDGA